MNQVVTNRSVKHDDKDLVQLAGYHAYKGYRKDNEIQVNGKVFIVEDTEYNTATGLDALTVRNVTVYNDNGELSEERNFNGELIIVFIGSDQLKGDWIDTNINLIGHAEPAQLEAAEDYFRDVEKNIGPVASVTGNSLGGALANRVAIAHPEVMSVTLNPAMLPGGMINFKKNYRNITNYQSEYDVLTHVQETIKFDHRIPGKKYHINNGLPIFSGIISNHKGYVNADPDGNYTVEVGTKGDAGHGSIHVGADYHIVTSIWSGAALHGGSSIPINLNTDDIFTLADGLKESVTGRLMLAGEYIDNAVDIIEDESAKFNQRITKLQETLHDLLDNLAGDPLLKGMAVTGNKMKNVIDDLIYVLDIAEEKCRFLNRILNSGPVEVIEFVFSLDISIESLFVPVRSYLLAIKKDIDQLTSETREIIKQDIPDLFKAEKDNFIDAVVGELDAHYSIVHKNKESMIGQVTEYEQQVRSVADVFKKLDHRLSLAIETNTLPPEDMEILQATSNFFLSPSPYIKNNLKIKELQLNIAHSLIKTKIISRLGPILISVKLLLASIEAGLEAIIIAINTSVNMVTNSPGGLLLDFFTNYIQQVRETAEGIKRPIIEMRDTVANLKTGIHASINNLPEMLEYFRDYIDTALFAPGKYQDVQLYNIASTAILNEMEILFSDIVFQLSNQEAKAIDATVATSRSVLANIEILREDIAKGTR